MKGNAMNWFLFFPPALSIYLLLISGISQQYIGKQITIAAASAGLKAKQNFIKNIALDWSARLNFFNSMVTAIFSGFSIWSKTQSYPAVVIHSAVLLAIFIFMMWWLMSYSAGELVDTKVKILSLKVTPAKICRFLLLLINILLGLEIYLSQ
jgi:hypothetical protein